MFFFKQNFFTQVKLQKQEKEVKEAKARAESA